MIGLRYPPRALLADYLRAAVGVSVTGMPLLFVEAASPVGYVLFALFALFFCFGVRTALRQFTAIHVTEEGIRAVGPWPRAVGWNELRQISLRYFATRRDRQGGWMQLRLVGSRRAVDVDSTLERFPAVVARAAAAAKTAGVQPNPATVENLKVLGIVWDDEPA